MKITVEQLKSMINEAISSRLNEGPKEIGIRSVMMDLKEPIVGSLAVDIAQETGMEELMVEKAVAQAYEKMIVDVVRSLDVGPARTEIPGTPRRRVVMGGTV